MVGILNIVYHAVGMIWAVLVMIMLAGGGLFARNREAILVVLVISLVISSLVIIFSIPGIIGGWALMKMKPWGRILALVMGFLSLIEIPLGTALGVYTIWALMNDETIKLFEAAGKGQSGSGVI